MASQACSSDVHLSIKWPERVYTDLTIWLNMLPLFTELVDVFLLNIFFQIVLGTRLIQKSNTAMT